MNRIQKAFDEKKKVFIGFVTAGDPNLATTKELVRAMIKGGAGLIEFGIPSPTPWLRARLSKKRICVRWLQALLPIKFLTS